jgi:predicted ATPase
LSYSCSPQHAYTAYYPLIAQIERASEFVHGDAPQQRLEKLAAYLAGNAVIEPDAALFVEMLFLRQDGRYPVLDLTPEQRRERTLQALVRRVEILAQRSPLLIVFEDAHWCDPTTLEFLSRTVAAIAPLCAFAIVTCRPEFGPPWVGQSHVTWLKLDRLDDQEAKKIAAQLVGECVLSANVLAEIAARADGKSAIRGGDHQGSDRGGERGQLALRRSGRPTSGTVGTVEFACFVDGEARSARRRGEGGRPNRCGDRTRIFVLSVGGSSFKRRR